MADLRLPKPTAAPRHSPVQYRLRTNPTNQCIGTSSRTLRALHQETTGPLAPIREPALALGCPEPQPFLPVCQHSSSRTTRFAARDPKTQNPHKRGPALPPEPPSHTSGQAALPGHLVPSPITRGPTPALGIPGSAARNTRTKLQPQVGRH